MKTLIKANILFLLLCFGASAQNSFFWQRVSNVDSLYLYSDSILSMPVNNSNRVAKNIQVNALRQGDSVLYAYALNLEAKSRFMSGELNQAAALHNEAYYQFLKFKDIQGQCASLIGLAQIDFEKGNIYPSQSKLRQTRDLARQLSSSYYSVLSAYHLAKVNMAQKEFMSAKTIVDEAKSEDNYNSIPEGLKFAINQLQARINIAMGNLPKAYELLTKSKQRSLQADYPYNLQLSWSKYWEAMGNPDKAVEAALKALNWAEGNKSPLIQIEAQINLSEVYLLKRENDLALEKAQLAINSQNRIPESIFLKQKALYQLYLSYLAINDSVKALNTVLRYKATEDSLMSFKLTQPQAVNTPPTSIKEEKIDTAAIIAHSKSDLTQAEVIKRKSKTLLLALLGIAGLLTFLGVVLYGLLTKRKRELKKLQEIHKALSEKEEKNEEEQEKLRETNKKLEALDKNKNKVFSVITHDVKQPINQIKSVLELLDMEDLSSDDRKNIVNKLRESIDQSSNALENILLWSKNQLTGINTKIVDVHLLPQVWQLESMVKVNLDSKNIRLDIDIPDFFKIKADMSQLDICLRNLVNNAIKFSNRGGVITIDAIEENGDKIIRVIDNGVGMSIDQVEKLKTMKGDFSTVGTMNEKGTGLGILITREFMENQNGSLDIVSRKGEGSIFSMVFHGQGNGQSPSPASKKQFRTP